MVKTRFAPSPTGYLHIGGARTALFNWLYARGRGGNFYLRIEDTDRKRHNEAAVEAIFDGLRWLGIDWDDEPISQFARRERHADIAEQLLASGNAYRCFLSPEELEKAREDAKAAGIRFESPWRDADPTSAPADTPYAIRFRAPNEGETTLSDAVQGSVTFPNSALDDLIIVRNDGAPTYNLAVVVDDHDMGITHVIRGDDHLNNAARQQQIYKALNWDVPQFAHIPLIHGGDGAKLSKRHGALGVEAYRDDGILSDALANYLLRLGWAHGDDEIISRENARQWFDLSGVNKAPARLDLDKLRHVNGVYISELDAQSFVDAAIPFLENAGHEITDERYTQLLRAGDAIKMRCATLMDAPGATAFLFLERPYEVTGKAGKPLRKESAPTHLREVAARLDALEHWESDALQQQIEAYVAEKEVGFGEVGGPLRAALTAGNPAPDLSIVLYSLGKYESIERIRQQIVE